MQHLRDEELMLEYQKGETLAMDELLKRYRNPVLAFAFRMTGNAGEAEDIAQEVFLRLHQFRSSYVLKAKFSTWIFSITHNLCVSCLRKRKWWGLWPRQKDDPDQPVDFASPDPSPDAVVAENDAAEKVKRCIQELPFLQKEALILREYGSLDYAQIAKILNKPEGTVKTLIHRARENLKIKLLPYQEELKGGCNE